jgi:hypothetical protein
MKAKIAQPGAAPAAIPVRFIAAGEHDRYLSFYPLRPLHFAMI